MTIKVTFLGTGGSIPSKERNTVSVLLSYKNENILFDCGEGTQRQFRKANLNPLKVTKIFITHWHGDHVLGLPGLLQTMAFLGYKKKLEIYGPRGTSRYVKEMFNTFVFVNKLDLSVKEVTKAGKVIDMKDFYIEAKGMTHGTPTNAYSFVKKGTLRIDKKKLKRSGLPATKILQDLKSGKDVKYKGKKYKAKDLTYMQDSKRVSIVLDTSLNSGIASFVKNSDLLICESSFSSELTEKAREHKHLTSKQAAGIASKSKSKKLVLVHLSPRYDKNPKVILNESKKVFKNSDVVDDLDVISV